MKYYMILQQAGGRRFYTFGDFDINWCSHPPTPQVVDAAIEQLRSSIRYGVGRAVGYAYLESLIKEDSVGAEIGVDWGDGLARLLQSKAKLIHAVDPWTTTDDKDPWTDVGQSVMDERYNYCVNTYGCKRVQFHRESSDEFFNNAEPESLDWAYIDGDHHREQVCKDALGAYRALKVGGVMAFDDCECARWKDGVRAGIRDFADDRVEFLNDSCDPWVLRKIS